MPASPSGSTSLPNETVEVTSISTVYSIAGQPAILSNISHSNTITNTNLGAQNAVSHQHSMNQLTTSIAAKAVNSVANVNPLDAIGALKILTGDAAASSIADIKAAEEA